LTKQREECENDGVEWANDDFLTTERGEKLNSIKLKKINKTPLNIIAWLPGV
jgi:hypothetical protein